MVVPEYWGVQRQDQDARCAVFLERIQLGRNGRRAVAHGWQHQHIVAPLAQPAAQQSGLACGPVQQRGAVFFMPDGGVLGGRLGRTGAQDDAVQNRPPGELGNLDHTIVTEKLRQIRAHCGGRGRGRRAQIAQQDAGACGLIVTEAGFGRKA